MRTDTTSIVAGSSASPLERMLGSLGLPAVIGVLAGTVAGSMATLEARWIAFPVAALVLGAVIAVVPDKGKLLAVTFVLSLQVNVAFRLFHGRAGSDGIALYLPLFTGLALLVYCLGTDRSPRQHFRFAGRLGVPIALLFGTTAFSLLWTDERFVGVAHFVLQIELYAMYCIALNVVRSEEDLERLTQLLLVTLGMQSAVYLIQSALGFTFTFTGQVIGAGAIPRPGGTVSTNPAGFASFVTPLLFIAIARFMTVRSRAQSIYLLALIGLGLTAIVITFTRAAWGAVVVGGVVLLALGERRRLVSISRFIVPAAVGLAIVAMSYATIQARLANSPLDAAYAERVALMRMALTTIAAHPLTGLGPGAYEHDYKAYLGDQTEGWKWRVHNEFLLRAAETGIPGGLSFIALLVIGLRVALRLSRARQLGIGTFGLAWSSGLVALAFSMYWVPWTGFAYNAILWLLLGVADALLLLPDATPPRR